MRLGIDIGTSKTAAVLLAEDGTTVAVASLPHAADLRGPEGFSEQDGGLLLRSVQEAVTALPAAGRAAVRTVGLTGQMHGMLILDERGEPLSPLVTWQDQRCNAGSFLRELKDRTGQPLRTGYGCATLAWLAHNGLLPRGAAGAATVQDWAAAMMCETARPVMDPTDAASWGFFKLGSLSWDLTAARAAGIPEHLLPEIVPCGSVIGVVGGASSERLGIPRGVPVVAAIGDNQASLIATLRNPESDLALTLGTGGQLSAVLPEERERSMALPLEASWECRPYPGGRRIAVAASLCGGSAWRWLAETAQGWTRDLGGQPPSMDNVYAKLNALGEASAPSRVAVTPSFLGERHDPSLRGAITEIDPSGLSLGTLARALAEGICVNLRGMLPARFMEGRALLVGSGNALERNPLLRQAAERVFRLPLVLGGRREAAAVGAALNAAV